MTGLTLTRMTSNRSGYNDRIDHSDRVDRDLDEQLQE